MRCSERARGGCRRLAAGLLLAGLPLVWAAELCALTTDVDQPIAIQADRAEHDDAVRTTVYRGDVVIDQGSLRITGDTVTIHFDRHDKVTKMIAVGTPAHFRQLPDGETGHREAWAKRMEYFPEQAFIVLQENARYEADGSRVQADRLVYDSRNARFKALSDVGGEGAGGEDDQAAGQSERVRIEINPKKDPTP